MSRRRSADPTTAIRITVRRSNLDALHDILDIGESRSAWIDSAIQMKLEGSKVFAMADANLRQRWVAFLSEAKEEGIWIEPMMTDIIDGVVKSWQNQQK